MRLCQNQDSLFLDNKQFKLELMQEMLNIETLFILLPTNTIFLEVESNMRHRLGSKVTLKPLSYT